MIIWDIKLEKSIDDIKYYPDILESNLRIRRCLDSLLLEYYKPGYINKDMIMSVIGYLNVVRAPNLFHEFARQMGHKMQGTVNSPGAFGIKDQYGEVIYATKKHSKDDAMVYNIHNPLLYDPIPWIRYVMTPGVIELFCDWWRHHNNGRLS